MKTIKLFVAGLLLSSSASVIANTNPSGKPNYLISFTADCNNYYAQIKWTTAEEVKSGYFIIERTKDGLHFETIAMLKNSATTGPTSVAHEYSIVDGSPLNGISYYRISEVDSTDKKVYINTIVYVPCENDETIDAVIEDSNVTIALNTVSEETRSCKVTIMDDYKSVVLNQTYKVVNGMNSFKIDTKLTGGVYLLKVNYRDDKSFNKVFKIEASEK
jgi:hypothetical protein